MTKLRPLLRMPKDGRICATCFYSRQGWTNKRGQHVLRCCYDNNQQLKNNVQTCRHWEDALV